jgi:hypothetical protein
MSVMDYQAIIAGTVGKENTFGTCVGRVKSGTMSFARYSTDDRRGIVRGYTGAGRFTDDPLETFGGAGVAEIPQLQKLLKFICREGFEHHVAANFSDVSKAVHEAAALSWMGEPPSSRARRLELLMGCINGSGFRWKARALQLRSRRFEVTRWEAEKSSSRYRLQRN